MKQVSLVEFSDFEPICEVRQEFFDMARRAVRKGLWPRFDKAPGGWAQNVYFIGKAVKPKGWVQLLNLLSQLPETEDWANFRLEVFGSGPDSEEIMDMVKEVNEKFGRESVP